MVEAKDAEIGVLRGELDAERELRRRLELRLAELERRLSMGSDDLGTPRSKERIGAKEARRARQQSERERRKDRRRGGQPGHEGKGLARDPDPGEKKNAEPQAECRKCRAGLDGAQAAGFRWAQVIDAEIIKKVTEWALPGLVCPCCGTVTFADAPPGAHAGSVSYGPVLNAAAVLLTAYGNVPPERAAQLIGMLLGTEVSPGWVRSGPVPGCLRCWARRAWMPRCSPRSPGRKHWPPTRPRSTCLSDEARTPRGRARRKKTRRRRTARQPPGLRTC